MSTGAGGRGGWSQVIVTENLMKDPRQQPSLLDNARLGAGKARKTVVFSHYDYRNVNRSAQARTGKVQRG